MLFTNVLASEEANSQNSSSSAHSPVATNPQQSFMSSVTGLLPLFLMLGLFYFLVFRPQEKKRKAHQQFLSGIKNGDEVSTSSGLIGKIVAIEQNHVSLEISDGVKVKIVKESILDVKK
ncbi:preprotein translocase subunit YajC [Rickettsiales endosymbiont of Paramecium tredecaurelia]|uniref:preprotein translocase subunit YajC n=1 Tax=Candidatus Sarmatiella mevalonica TaxID=2770581 RepID=UPI0019214518|nr:preprotein translocase subunit YajC [Candidatus Sarmatiella mevalonica]MBL3284226.1 preprotein translocase subunit YajC [Candidatus Sarmatiella mevalonica]